MCFFLLMEKPFQRAKMKGEKKLNISIIWFSSLVFFIILAYVLYSAHGKFDITTQLSSFSKILLLFGTINLLIAQQILSSKGFLRKTFFPGSHELSDVARMICMGVIESASILGFIAAMNTGNALVFTFFVALGALLILIYKPSIKSES